MAILVIKHSALGDMILALPLLRAIRRHHLGERIVVLTTAPYADLLQQSGHADEIWIDERPKFWQPMKLRSLLRRIRAADFGRIYDLQGSQRTKSYYRLLGAPADLWVGNAPGCRYHIPDPTEPMHIAELRRRQLALVGIEDPGLPDLDFLQTDIGRFDLPQRYALLVPGGAPHRPAKRWPAERFAALGRHLMMQGITPVLIGRAAEKAEVADILTACQGAISLCDRTSIADLASLGRAAMVCIGNDTGPMHIIAAAGCPTLVLYSAESDPRKISPRGEWVRLMQRQNLQDLSVDDAIAALPPFRS
ncbi:MAG: glycosyltransferase family 9 protein [Ferrovibrio sp.]